jgi:hypothetical protein
MSVCSVSAETVLPSINGHWKLHVMSYSNSRMTDWIFIEFGMLVMSLEATLN